MRAVFVCAAALAGAVLVAACDDVVKDATFRQWCGDSLCEWTVESGSIQKAATWHKNDHGVELVGTPTVLSQTSGSSPRCLTFTTIADVAPGAQVMIGLDFNADGTIESEQPIAATGFREAKTQVTAPLYYEGLRVVISKKGDGKTVLAQIRVQSSNECSAPPLAIKDLALGTPCSLIDGGDECRSGVCCDGICAECCVPPAIGQAAPNGELVSPQIVPCPGDASCASRDVRSMRNNLQPAVPRQCDPGQNAKQSGDECLADDDCVSGDCQGASARVFKPSLGSSGAAMVDGEFPDAGPDGLFNVLRGGRCK